MAKEYKVLVNDDVTNKEYYMSIEKPEVTDGQELKRSEDNISKKVEANDKAYMSECSYTAAFPAAKTLLESAINEYNREKERSNSLDNKAGVFIAVLITLITVYIQVLPLGEIINAYEKSSKLGASMMTASIVLLVAGVSLVTTSFFKL